MAVVAAPVSRLRFRFPSRIVVGLTILTSAILYAWMRISVADGIREPFVRYCAQLHMQPQDWPCRLSHATALATYLGGSLLVWLALALPGMILAAAGRRLWAVLPATAAVMGLFAGTVVSWVTQTSGGHSFFGIDASLGIGPAGSFWTRHSAGAVLFDLVLVSLPALAIAAARTRARRPLLSPEPRPADTLAAAAVCAAGVALIVGAGLRIHLLYGNEWYSISALDAIISVVVMAAFGAVMGTDRRWWPWALAPVAVLLSLGPTSALFGLPGQTVALGRFGAAVPLAAVGLVASLWRPLALRRTAWAADDSRSIGTAGDAVSAQPKPRSRPWLALTTVSVGILTLAALANAYDPLPAQIGTTIPTYLGLRERAMDVRTRTDLRGAIGTMDGYRARTGTYAGFVAAQGHTDTPAITWVNGTPQGVDVVGLTQASDDMAEVVALSGSGAAFCVRSLVTPTGTAVTYGTGTDASAARADCGFTPWTDSATAFPSFAALCDDVDDQTIFVCRNVQYLLRKTIGAPAAG